MYYRYTLETINFNSRRKDYPQFTNYITTTKWSKGQILNGNLKVIHRVNL